MKYIETALGEEHRCTCCGNFFTDGDILMARDNTLFCTDCFGSEETESYTKYMVAENKIKKFWNNSLFSKLENGVYELRPSADGFLMNSYEEKASAGYILKCTYTGSFLLEKMGGNAMLLFPEIMQTSKLDFFNGGTGCETAVSDFKEYSECKDYYVVINEINNKVTGISTMGGRRSRLNDFSVCRTGFKSVPLKEFKCECVKDSLDKCVSASMKRLTPMVMLDYCKKRVMGQDDELKKAVYMIYRYMKSVADNTLKNAENWILTAPSGSGKTEFFRAVRDMFEEYNVPIPVVQVDLSRITEEGFKGENASAIPKHILQENTGLNGIGICFLDEMDKKCVPSYASHNVNINAAIQANLLTLTEGIKLMVDMDGENVSYNSEKTMFVLMGAFQDVRNEKSEEKSSGPSLGFSACFDEKDNTDKADDAFYESLTLQDIVDYGMLEELAGRMSQLINFRRLSREDMSSLIKCKTDAVSQELEIDIELTENAEQELLDVSFGSLGVRRPINIIKSLAQNAVAAVFFDRGFDNWCDKVVISSAEHAHVEKKCNVILNPKERKMCNEELCILRKGQAIG